MLKLQVATNAKTYQDLITQSEDVRKHLYDIAKERVTAEIRLEDMLGLDLTETRLANDNIEFLGNQYEGTFSELTRLNKEIEAVQEQRGPLQDALESLANDLSDLEDSIADESGVLEGLISSWEEMDADEYHSLLESRGELQMQIIELEKRLSLL